MPYRASAKYAEEKSLACAKPNGREIWPRIALPYRTRVGFAKRRCDDELW